MSGKSLFGSSFSMSNEVNFIGKKTEVRCQGKSWPQLSDGEVKEPVQAAAFLPAVLGAIPLSSGTGTVSPAVMAALGAISAAGTILVTQNQNSGQLSADYALSLMKVMNGAYAKNGNLNEEELKKLIMLLMSQMLEKAGPAFAEWNQILMNLMQNATMDQFLKGVQSAVCAMTGDPVNANTGNFIYELEDLLIKGRNPLCFKRFYNRIDEREGCMGKGWRHNYEIQLMIEKGSYTIIWDDGREEIYLRDEQNKAEPLFGCYCRLWKEASHFLYETQEGVTYTFNEQGKVITQTARNGQGIRFDYDTCGRLSRVSNGNGSSLTYQYDSSIGRLQKVKDHTGRTIELTYELGRLVKVANAEGDSYSYYYDSDKTVHRIRNPRDVFVLENYYDDRGRTVKQVFADGGIIRYDYQDDSSRTLVTQQNGAKAAYVHDERYRNIKTIYEDGDEKFAYNDRNQMTLRVDKNGNKTKFAYDDKGNISQIIYPDGCKHNMTYDANNRLLALSVNGETKIKNAYDSHGNLYHMEDALGKEREFIYDEEGRVKEIIQADQSRICLQYDVRSNISRITDGAGNKTSYTYDELNRVVKTVDGNGNRTSYEYDLCDRLTRVINAEGKNRSYEYTKNGKVTKVIDFNGAVTSQSYNNMNQVSSVITPDGGKVILEYDQMQNVTKKIAPNGAEFLYEYAGLNRLESVTMPGSGTILYEYDANGNRTSVTDGSGNKTSMEYDERNRVTAVVDASGARTEYDYDMEGNLISITNAMGQSFIFTYDEAGQKISETDILGNVIGYEYNELGKISGVTNPKQRKTTYVYGLGGVLKKAVYPDGSYEQYSYDKNGNLIHRENQKGNYLEFIYDCLDRLAKVKSSFGQEKSYIYDAVGNVTSMTDTLGNVTRYEYSMGGNLTAVTDAMGNKTEYGYDAMGNLITICQHEGSDTLLNSNILQAYIKNLNGENKVHLTTYKRNLMGEVETITDPLGLQEHYTYNQACQMIGKQDKEGYETRYDYTPTGEISGISYEDGRSVAFSYNPLKQLAEVNDWLGTTKIEVETAGRAKKITDYKGREIGYEWGGLGERTALIYPNGRKVVYEYDEFSHLNRLIHEGEEVMYHYDEEGRLMEKGFPNGIITSCRYNAMGLLKRLTHKADGKVLDMYDYEYDLAGNKTKIRKERAVPFQSEHISEEICRKLKKENGTYDYRYDKLNRLIEVNKDRESQCRYEYDAFGNRIKKREGRVTSFYKYNAANQLLEINGSEAERYQYDKRGNLTGILKGGKLDIGYLYDVTNRLSRVVNAKAEMAQYNYCGLGYRIGKQEYKKGRPSAWRETWKEEDHENETPAAQIDYLLDLTKSYHNLLSKAETTDQGLNTQEYIWDSNVVSMVGEKDSYTYLQDELGSPIRLLDMQENCGAVYGYDEFGQDLFGNQGEMQPFGYTGYQKDRMANTYFAQAREYMPRIGRFAGEDLLKGRILRPKTLNRYQYCINNPLNYLDANGLAPIRVSNPSSALDTSKYLYYDKEITSREKAIEALRVYANKYGNEDISTINSEYPHFNGNCANFVSQCLYASGLDMTAIVKSGIMEAGDLLYWDEEDEDTDVNHATILTKVTDDLYYAGNTRRRFDEPARESFKDYLKNGPSNLYLVRLKDSAFIADCPSAN